MSISGSLVTLNGAGTARQERTKTKGFARTVPLADDAYVALVSRAAVFGRCLDDGDGLDLQIFRSPQPDRWRDYLNLTRAIKELFDRHGVDDGRGHLGRKWRVTSLVERGVPVHKTADLVGHGNIKTTFGYLGRGHQTDPDVRAAL